MLAGQKTEEEEYLDEHFEELHDALLAKMERMNAQVMKDSKDRVAAVQAEMEREHQKAVHGWG